MSEEAIVDLTTSEQAKTFINAEEALGDRLVAKVLRLFWNPELRDSYCAMDCSRCGNDLGDVEVGWVWAAPANGAEHCEVAALQTFCTQECADETIKEWAFGHQKDVVIGYYTL